jgi:hypothetical protein
MFAIRILRNANVDWSYCGTGESSSSMRMKAFKPYPPKNIARGCRFFCDWNQPNLESSERVPLLEIAIRLRTDCVTYLGVVCMCGCVFVTRVPTGIMFF